MANPASTRSAAEMEAVRKKLQQMIAEGRVEEMLDVATSLLAGVRDENTALRHRLDMALRRLYGRRSEKVSAHELQIMLALSGMTAAELGITRPPPPPPTGPDGEPLVPPAPPPPPLRTKKNKQGRKPISDALEREVRTVVVPASERDCPDCGKPRTACGHETSESFGFIPAKIVVIQEKREKLVCRACETLVTAPLGDRMIDGGRPSAGLLAHLLVSKYSDGLPLHRVLEVFARMGLVVSSSTLSDWVAAAATILEALALRIRQRVLESAIINVDDTPLPVLDKDDPRGIKKGRIWAYVGDRSLVVYDYTPSWEADHPCAFLATFGGFLQGDGYAGYERLTDVTLLGCHMHARRKFEAAMKAGDPRAAIAMQLYRRIYDLERDYKENALSDDARKERRLRESKPLFDELKAWVDQLHPTLTPTSLLAKATTYATNQWDYLVAFFQDGRLEIDNGEVERRLRRVTMGRDAYLFAGSDAGAERAATAYTVIVSARVHGHDPWRYLVDVMTALQRGWPLARLDELLPDRWTQEAAEQRQAQRPPDNVAS